jgi:hypothetical protein
MKRNGERNEMNTSIDSLLDGTLDSLPDLKGFSVFPSGAYRVSLPDGLVEKQIGEHPAVELLMRCEEVLELTEPGEEAPAVGDECSSAFMLDNDTGLGFFKEIMKVIIPACGASNIRQAMEACKGMEFVAVLAKTHDKAKDRDYCNVKKFAAL